MQKEKETQDTLEETKEIKAEFDNKLKMKEGVLAMARSSSYDSASSQFFIVTKDTPAIDGQYAGFGKVIEGMDVVDKIANTEVVYRSSELGENEEVPTDDEGNTISSDRPVNPPVITKMTGDTFGVDYGDYETVEPFDYTSWLYSYYGLQ